MVLRWEMAAKKRYISKLGHEKIPPDKFFFKFSVSSIKEFFISHFLEFPFHIYDARGCSIETELILATVLDIIAVFRLIFFTTNGE